MRVLGFLLGLGLLVGDATADWPQWRGPLRDGHAAADDLLQQWPEGGPELVFQFGGAGRGYSAVSVVDGKLLTLGADDSVTFALCVDLKSGEQVWRTEVSRTGGTEDYNLGWGGGPRSTPTVDGEDVFVLSDVGVVACLDRNSGAMRWSVDLVKQFGGGIPTWGYSESLLVDGDRVICTPGGENFLVGLDRATGEKVWGSSGVNAPAQYVSVMRGNAGGRDYYVTASKPGLFGFDVETGAKVFSDESTGNNVAVIPTPVLLDDGLYHTSDYGAGCTLLRRSGDAMRSVYHRTGKTMRNHHGGVVLVDGVIYGFSKGSGGVWMAQDLESGEVLWQEKLRPNRSGSIAYADGRLYCYNDKDGVCWLVRPSREKWDPVGSVALPRQTETPRGQGAIWAHPVISDGMLLIRDQELVFGFDVGS